MTEIRSFEIDRSQRRLGPIWLTAGVAPGNVLTLFYSSMVTIVFITATGILLPFLLHEHLNMPEEVQGNFAGNLVVIVELVAIAIAIPIGVASDRWGRRPLYAAGFFMAFLGFAFLPLARAPETLIVFRVLAGAGLSFGTTMLAAAIADYPQNASRGKLISINGVITNIGVIILSAILFGQMPKLLVARGVEPYDAGTYTFWAMAGLALLTAGVTYLGLKGGRAVSQMSRNWGDLMRTGFKEVRKNPRLELACAAYFVSRGDLTVFVTFFSLWLVAVGKDSGMTTEDAQAAAARLFGVAQTSMLLFTPVIGIMCDRLDRVTALAIAMGIAFVGYLALGIVDDPLNNSFMYAAAILGGAGEAAVVVSGPALVGQEATPKVRGSIIGVVALSGAVGVLLHSKASGMFYDDWLFDEWRRQMPFVYMAIMNLLICVAALGLRWWEIKSGVATHPSAASARKSIAAGEAQAEGSIEMTAKTLDDTPPPAS